MPAITFTRGDLTIEVWPASVYAPAKWVALPDYFDGEEDADPSCRIQAFGDTPEEAADELAFQIEQASATGAA